MDNAPEFAIGESAAGSTTRARRRTTTTTRKRGGGIPLGEWDAAQATPRLGGVGHRIARIKSSAVREFTWRVIKPRTNPHSARRYIARGSPLPLPTIGGSGAARPLAKVP